MERRALLRGFAGFAGLAGVGVPAAPQAAAPAGMPTYTYLRDALKTPLRYNPTGEFIFPCIRGVYDKVSGARSRY
jgi:hypothetical protein